MSQSEQKVVQYLNEAHANEIAQLGVLQSQIAMAPRGSYRDGLETHLAETQAHARHIQERLGELGEGRNPLQVFVGLTETLIGQLLALSKTPIDLLRGTGGEEKVLANAKDACATDALEIATYAALERLASQVGDEQTAKLAASIRGDEERMLKRTMGEIPKLTDALVEAALEGDRSDEVTTTGAADAARRATRAGRKSSRASAPARSTARRSQKVSGPTTQTEPRRPRTGALSGPEPWPGYDELTVAEIDAVLGEGDDRRAQEVLAYERAHKNRPEVLRSALVPARFLSTANN